MSSSIHYRFASASDYDTISFDGQSITVGALRDAIMTVNRISKTLSYTLQISNARNREVLSDDSFLLQKNSSVIVKKINKSYHDPTTTQTNVTNNTVITAIPTTTTNTTTTNQTTSNRNEHNISGNKKSRDVDCDPIKPKYFSAQVVRSMRSLNGDKRCQLPGPYYSWRLVVRGLEMGSTADDVRKYFSLFGRIESVDLPCDEVTKKRIGVAYIAFENTDTISKVLKAKHHRINGRTVEVKKISAEDQRKQQQQLKQGQQQSDGSREGRVPHRKKTHQPQIPSQQSVTSVVGGSSIQATTLQSPGIVPAAQSGYVYEPTTNTYYQLPTVGTAGIGHSSNSYVPTYPKVASTNAFHPYLR